MKILGLTTMTESSAALLIDGEIVAAAEEERFSRVKHHGGFPFRSIAYVLASRGLTLADIDHVAVYWDPFRLGRRFKYLLEQLFLDPKFFFEKLQRAASVWQGSHTSGESAGWGSIFKTGENFREHFQSSPKSIRFLNHHLVHMASCFFGSQYDEAAILVMDGAGEAECTSSGVGRGTSLKFLEKHYVPDSLGHFYSAITGYLGFRMLDGEYKLMGLSPYGEPTGVRWIRDNYLVTPRPGRYKLNAKVLDYHRALRGEFRGAFTDHFGPPRELSETAVFDDRHRMIASSAQKAFEEVVLDLAFDLRRRTGLTKLAIAGGCGLNCVANGRILLSDVFDEIYVPPVPHDAGGSIGAAMLLYSQLTGVRAKPIQHAQFGPEFSNNEIASVLKGFPELKGEQLSEEALVDRAASSLARGEVLSWMQGRMEYGPRALGNRSFLADPRNDSIRDAINAKIKKRELFRPFAPSVKAEKASEYFEIDQPSPFMTIIVPVREGKRELIPAVTHVDGTARPQTVDRELNPRYWKLLDRFEQRTGVPVLLNTSFNIQEPIVCSPQDALTTFTRSQVDALAIGDFWVTRETPLK